MKFEYGNNDCEPCVVVTKEDGELVVMFEGFGGEEAKQWFNSKDVMSSLESWHNMMGDYEMAYKQINGRGFEMNEIEKMLNDIRKNPEVNLKDCPPGHGSDRVSYYELGGDVIAVSHQFGEVIFDGDVVEEGGIECLFGENMTTEKFELALGNKEFITFLKQWCEEEHCTRALISRVDPGTRSTA